MNCIRRLLCKSDDDASSLYRDGVRAIQEGRYVISETIFHQIIHTHPSYKFWINLHNRVRRTNASGSDDRACGASNELTKDAETSSSELIELSLDNQVIQVIDFIRLCMDIAYTYLNEPADEMNGRLAMTYYALVITYLFEFFHLMMLWRSEVGEDLMVQSKHGGNFGDKLFATPLDIMRSFRCMKHTFLFYFVSATLNYIVLSLQYIHHLDVSKNKLKERVLNNCLELTNLTHLVVKWTVCSMPESATAQTVLQNMPSVEFTPYEEDETEDEQDIVCKNDSFSSRLKVRSVNENWGSLVDTISNPKGLSSFFFHAKRMNPSMRLVRELPKNHQVRLGITTQMLRHQLACIETPTQRNSFHYISWFFAEDVTMVPGQSAHYLARELPDLFGIHGKFPLMQTVGDAIEQHTSLKVNPKARDTSAVFFKSGGAARLLTAFETNQNTCKRKTCARTVESLKRHLNLCDFRMLAVVGLEELMLVGAPVLVITSCLLAEMGRHERAMEFDLLLDLNAGLMYGTNSPEYDFLVSLRDFCTVKL
ncbi:unnamed protein product [Phytomonas sp. EM1]|nr:unnamed protein product [Phytomonas sp. EM1]|eukprot:CCW65855.1 unnamed protein product [Phytomonas sp. isolate EM1]